MELFSLRESVLAQQELESLRKVFIAMDHDGDGLISERDLAHVLAHLEYRPRKNEIADMIWEVDEDCDHHVSWAEFELMFSRCRSDMVRRREALASCAAARPPSHRSCARVAHPTLSFRVWRPRPPPRPVLSRASSSTSSSS
jgi:hypothetical protein